METRIKPNQLFRSVPTTTPLDQKGAGLKLSITATTNPKETFLKTVTNSIDTTCFVTDDGKMVRYHHLQKELYVMDSTYTKGHVINLGAAIFLATTIGNAIIIQLEDYLLLFDANTLKLLDQKKIDMATEFLNLDEALSTSDSSQFLCREPLTNSIAHYDISQNKLKLIARISSDQQITAMAINRLGELLISVVNNVTKKTTLMTFKQTTSLISVKWDCTDKRPGSDAHTMIHADGQLITIYYKSGVHLQNTVKGTAASFLNSPPKSQFHLLGSYLLTMAISDYADKYFHCLYLIDINTMNYFRVDFPDRNIINLKVTKQGKLFFITKNRMYDMDKKAELLPELAALSPAYQLMKTGQYLPSSMFKSFSADKPMLADEKEKIIIPPATDQKLKQDQTSFSFAAADLGHFTKPATFFHNERELKIKMMALLADKVIKGNLDASNPRAKKELEQYLKNPSNFHVGKNDTVRQLISDVGKQAQELLTADKKRMAALNEKASIRI